MSKLLDFILCSGITISELIIIFIVSVFIQFIVFRITGISIYNQLIKLMFKADKYITTNFN